MRTLIALVALFTSTSFAAEYHVTVSGDNANSGTKAKPFKTIAAAANVAQPGDIITVHEGIYRERVNPPRGGESNTRRIAYQAAPGEKVVITGSEIVKGWEKVTNDTWKVTLPNRFFGEFNPFTDLVQGEWCRSTGRHTGGVYLNGDWLDEARSLAEVLKPTAKRPCHFAQVDATNTTVWAQFPSANPNDSTVEINVRQSVFYPSRPGIKFITVRGFTLRQAATPWAGAMSEQVGLIGTHWSKGWIIENNDISYSIGTGIALGRYELPKGQMPPATAPGFVTSTEYALRDGWAKENIGSHIVRNNRISHCEKNAIHGSLGGAFSTITGNEIHDIAVRGWLNGDDIAAIKFLGGVDVRIDANHIYRNRCFGIWLDWMAQGAQVTGNLLHDNHQADIFCEMQHGPLLIANNLLVSCPHTVLLNSKSMSIVHNLVLGDLRHLRYDARRTPFHPAHTTTVAGLRDAPSGDHRIYNNLFLGSWNGATLNDAILPCFASGNVFVKAATPSKFDTNAVLRPGFDTGIQLEQKSDGWYLTFNADKSWRDARKRELVTTEMLGRAKIPNLPYEYSDGTPIKVDTDYSGHKRDNGNPFPGPFEITVDGTQTIKVWPKP